MSVNFRELNSSIASRYLEIKGCGANKPGGGGFSSGNTCARGGSSGTSISAYGSGEATEIHNAFREQYKSEIAAITGKGLPSDKAGQAIAMMEFGFRDLSFSGGNPKLLVAQSGGKVTGNLIYRTTETDLSVSFMGSVSPLAGFKLFKTVLNTASEQGMGIKWTSAPTKNAEKFWKKTGLPYKKEMGVLKFSMSNSNVKDFLSKKKETKAVVNVLEDWWSKEDWPGAFIGDLRKAEFLRPKMAR